MPAPARVSKRVFLGARTCPTKSWFLRHLPAGELSEGDNLRIQEGTEIGERVRRLFQNGVLVEERGLVKAAARTAELTADANVKVIFEATFLAGDYVAKADVLVREPGGWEVLEVKSNKNLKDELVEDLAYTVNVARHAGIFPAVAKLMLLSPKFRVGMSEAELFQDDIDLTGEVFELVEDFEAIWDAVPGYIKRAQPIEPRLIWNCRQCEFFKTVCLGKDSAHHVFDLPYLREVTFQRLCEQEVTLIRNIRDDFPLTDQQQRVRQAVSTGQPVVNRQEISRAMASVDWPARYLDWTYPRLVGALILG